MTIISQLFRPSRVVPARRTRLAIESLEARDQPSAGPVDLGTAANFGVLGLVRVQIDNAGGTIIGDVGVSRGGHLQNGARGTITGTVEDFTASGYSGRGHVGKVVTDPAAMNKADADALSASAAAAALSPTQSFGSINSPRTVTGNGGLNVIAINGSINASLTLSGGANDEFIVNVSGGLNLSGRETLALAGGVTADHVIYNFVGSRGAISTSSRSVVNGTLLGVQRGFSISGVVNGEVIGGQGIQVNRSAAINAVAFTGVQAGPATLSGIVFNDGDRDGLMNTPSQDTGLGGVVVTLTGADSKGAVSLTATTAADGSYTFTGLSAGTYTVSRVAPAFFDNGACLLGTVGTKPVGVATPTCIDQVTLSNGDTAVNYNFAELQAILA